MTEKRPWFESIFDGDYIRSYAMMNEAATLHADHLTAVLGLPPGASILDVGGGYGRIAIPLAQRGYRMTVLDLSEYFLRVGAENAQRAGVEIEWLQADMRDVPQSASYDAVVNLYGSFGYFDADEDNERVVRAIHGALKPGAPFVWETVNREVLVRRGSPFQMWSEVPGAVTLEECSFDVVTGRCDTHRVFYDLESGERRESSYSVRMFSAAELRRMVHGAGFVEPRFYGGLNGTPLTMDASRVVVVALRAAN